MEKEKARIEKGTMRARWRQCMKCPPKQKEHKVLPKIYHETILPGHYTDGEYICEDCLELDRNRYQRLAEAINKELERRDRIYQQAGY